MSFLPFTRFGPAKKVFVVVVVVVVTFAYWEVGVRYLAKTAFPLLRTDPEVGSIHVKNYSGYAWDVESARKNFIRTNSLGYVGEDVAVAKPTSTLRIAMLGDSTLAGLQVDYTKNFVSLLQDELSATPFCGKNKFEVMNFGVGSAGTFIEYQIYAKKVVPYHPDYVFIVFHDDYADNIAKANYSLEHYSEERRSVGLKGFLLQFELPKLIFSKLKNNEVLLSVLRHIGFFETTAPAAMSSVVATTSPTASTSTDKYYTYTFQVMDRLTTLIKENGSIPVVLILPYEHDLAAAGKWKENTSTAAMVAYLDHTGIASINPADEMAAMKAARGGGCLSFGCGDHLNEAGHEVMAALLYRDMQTRLPANKALCPAPK